MKIIRHGVIPEEVPYQATCRNCHTEFEFLQREGKVTRDQRDGDFVSVHCPVCQTLVSVDLTQRP